MSGTPSYGIESQLGIDSSTPVAHRFDFQNETLRLKEQFPYLGGLRGTRSREVKQVRAGKRVVSGQLFLQPTAAELALLLPWILGGSTSGSPAVSYALAETVPTRAVVVDRVAKVYTYDHCLVTKATFQSSEGMPLEVILDLVGKDESEGNSGTFPALTLDTANGPMMFFDLVLTIAASAYSAKDFTLTIDNQIDQNRFFNSQTLSATTNARDRLVTLTTRLPHGEATAAYNTGVAGVAVDATFTNGGAVLDFSFVKVCFPRESPETNRREEIMLPLTGSAYKSGSTAEIVTTLNPGP